MKRSLGAETLVYPTPVFIIGSYDAEGRPNLMNAAWGGICCSDPPCVAVSIRPQRKTHENVMHTQAFTVNIPSVRWVREADHVGVYSGHDEDKFAATGLTPVRAEHVNAPYVEQFPLVLECRVLHIHDLGAHTQFVGRIVDVKADEEALDAAGNLDIRRVKPFVFAPGNNAYFAIGEFLGDAFSLGCRAQ